MRYQRQIAYILPKTLRLFSMDVTKFDGKSIWTRKCDFWHWVAIQKNPLNSNCRASVNWPFLLALLSHFISIHSKDHTTTTTIYKTNNGILRVTICCGESGASIFHVMNVCGCFLSECIGIEHWNNGVCFLLWVGSAFRNRPNNVVQSHPRCYDVVLFIKLCQFNSRIVSKSHNNYNNVVFEMAEIRRRNKAYYFMANDVKRCQSFGSCHFSQITT